MRNDDASEFEFRIINISEYTLKLKKNTKFKNHIEHIFNKPIYNTITKNEKTL